MFTRQLVTDMLEAFDGNLKVWFLCESSKVFKHKWQKNPYFFIEVQRWAFKFVDQHHEHLYVARSNEDALFGISKTQTTREIRLTFLTWLLEQPDFN